MPNGVAFTTPSASASSSGSAAVDAPRTDPRVERCDLLRQLLGTVAGDVDQHEFSDLLDSASAVATADPAPPAPTITTRARGESPKDASNADPNPVTSVLWPIGALAVEDHRVAGADATRTGVELVEQRNDRLLERMRDVEPVEPHPARRPQQLREALGQWPRPVSIVRYT